MRPADTGAIAPAPLPSAGGDVNRQGMLALILGAVLAACTAQAVAEPLALIQAHAHNDYAHARPLLDALSHGFCSLEADIYLVDGQLLVAHDLDDVRPDRTLEALYLDPLRERVARNGGRVYPNGPECTLLIDVKSNAASTYAVLRGVLERYAEMFTVFRGERVERGAITAIVSGERAPWLMAAEPVRYAALDGTLADLSANASADLVPWISADWKKTFTWDGASAMPEEQQRLLRQIVSKAHEQGRRVRFWGTPDTPAFWKVLWDAGVDLINTDDLAGLEGFLRDRSPTVR